MSFQYTDNKKIVDDLDAKLGTRFMDVNSYLCNQCSLKLVKVLDNCFVDTPPGFIAEYGEISKDGVRVFATFTHSNDQIRFVLDSFRASILFSYHGEKES